MALELIIAQRTELSQELQVRQTIEFCNLMKIPDEAMSAVINAASYNPDSIESYLGQRENSRESMFSTDKKIQSVYSSLTGAKENVKYSKGIIMTPEAESLEEYVNQKRIIATPDVTYVGMQNKKPAIVFSDHLAGAMKLSLFQIKSSKYPKTAKLINDLRRFDEWKRATLRNIYPIIGSEQREFFESFNTEKLNPFPQRDLAKRVDLHYSTISRLLSNRWVKGISAKGEEEKIFYTKDLLPTQDKILRYASAPLINRILEAEFAKKEAFSDKELSEKVGILKRRTIAKYRKMSGMPNSPKRKRRYNENIIEGPYKIQELL